MMADISFEDVLKMAEQLPENEQNRLIYNLRLKQIQHKPQPPTAKGHEPRRDKWYVERGSEYVEYDRNPTREELITELENLRAVGAFDDIESLYGKYANPNAPAMTEDEFHADLHAIATEWEHELDDLDPDNS